jgi:hypothetical protein
VATDQTGAPVAAPERHALHRWPLLQMLIALLWAFVVVAVYHVAHKPFTVSNLLALGQAAIGLAVSTIIVLLGIGLGRRLLGELPDATGMERLVWSAAVGCGALSLLPLALGLLGWLRPWLLWVLTPIGLIALRRPLRQALRSALDDRGWLPQTRFERLLALYCGAMLSVALLWSLAPPTAWDALVYHLTGPKLYLQSGRVALPFDLPYLGFPQLAEMLFAWALALGGERAVAPIHWFYAALAALVLVAAGRRWLGNAAGWLAAAILLSAETVVLLAGWPYVDLTLLLYATLAFLSLTCWNKTEPGSLKWLIVGGVLAGFALSTKYTALALLPALALVLALRFELQLVNLKAWMSLLKLEIWHLAPALIVWFPWMLKNMMTAGNPTYPFFFGGPQWDSWRAWWYDRPGTGLLYSAPLRLLVAPWEATIWGVEGLNGYSATIGPLFLALMPLLFLSWQGLEAGQRRWLRSALIFCGVLYAFWLCGVARSALLFQSRLLFPAFGLFALIAAAAIEGLCLLPRRPLDLAWLMRAVLVGVLALTLLGTVLGQVSNNPLAILLGAENRDDFLTHRLGWYYRALQSVNADLPDGAVVLFLWEPRSYHCRAGIECRPDALLDRFLRTTHLYGHDAQAIADHWRAEGVTHVLFYRLGLQAILEGRFDPITLEDVSTLQALQSNHLTLVKSFGDAYVLYRLREK